MPIKKGIAAEKVGLRVAELVVSTAVLTSISSRKQNRFTENSTDR